MEMLEKIQLPASQAEDINAESTRWKDGRLVSLDEGDYISLYIAHEDAVIDELMPGADGQEAQESQPRHVVYAQLIRVHKPLTRDMAINAAEMSAYGLGNAMEVASFNASLSRKSRINASDAEVAEHDAFIGWVKEELTKIGV